MSASNGQDGRDEKPTTSLVECRTLTQKDGWVKRQRAADGFGPVLRWTLAEYCQKCG